MDVDEHPRYDGIGMAELVRAGEVPASELHRRDLCSAGSKAATFRLRQRPGLDQVVIGRS